MKVWKKNILDKEKSKSKYKVPEVGMNLSVRSLGLKLEHHQNHLEGLLNHRLLVLSQEFLFSMSGVGLRNLHV